MENELFTVSGFDDALSAKDAEMERLVSRIAELEDGRCTGTPVSPGVIVNICCSRRTWCCY